MATVSEDKAALYAAYDVLFEIAKQHAAGNHEAVKQMARNLAGPCSILSQIRRSIETV